MPANQLRKALDVVQLVALRRELTVREIGGLGWATTDLVNARSLIEMSG